MKHLAPVILILLGAYSTALAQDYNVEVTPFGGYRFGGDFDVTDGNGDSDAGSSVKLRDAGSYGVLLDLRHSDVTTYQFLYSEQSTTADVNDPDASLSTVDTTLRILQFGGTYRGPGDVVQPYLAATIGGTNIRTSANGSQSDTFFSGSIGVGVNVMPTNRVGFRFEARAYGTLTDSDTDLFCQTGPELNVCAVRVKGTILSQFETFAGFTVRF